ncbi:MAG: transglycosylase SLT domain-containing protein, partial [Hyphomonadaceae bacterium]
MTPEAIGGSPVRQAIAHASRTTGMSFQFLLSTAVRESSLNPKAEAKTSSATGLFQFLDATWLTTVKRHGAKHGLGAEASMIEMGANGRPNVADPGLRRAILDLRYDPKISSLMAAEFAGDNADYLRGRTGQEPEAGDLYAAHFLGAGGAAELVNAARDRPWASAADLFPSAAAANRPIFYKNGGA